MLLSDLPSRSQLLPPTVMLATADLLKASLVASFLSRQYISAVSHVPFLAEPPRATSASPFSLGTQHPARGIHSPAYLQHLLNRGGAGINNNSKK